MANGRQGWVEIREQQPKPLCRNGSRDGSAVAQAYSLTLVFLEQFFISGYDGHRALWGVAVGAGSGIHRNNIILNI